MDMCMNWNTSGIGFSAALRGCAASVFVVAALLQGCARPYQAPLDDQSRVLDRQPPPIYSTTGGASAPASPPVQSGNTSGGSNARTIAAGVRVDPAPGVNVNVVNETTGIRRSGISRAPLDGTGAPVSAGQSPDAAPSPTPAPAVSAPPSSSPSGSPASGAMTHTVVRGDTLYSIAYRYSLDVRALAVANNLTPPYTIYPDQRLTLDTGAVSTSVLTEVPALAPASTGQRPQASVANRRVNQAASRVVEGVAWQWPLDGRVLRSFSASAATTSRGIDISGRRGDPVYAAADGDVVYAGRGIQGQGDLIIIRHSARHLSAYSHNSNMLVTEGARIQAGDKISEVGTDPRGTELIHFEIRVDGKPSDPASYLPPR